MLLKMEQRHQKLKKKNAENDHQILQQYLINKYGDC